MTNDEREQLFSDWLDDALEAQYGHEPLDCGPF